MTIKLFKPKYRLIYNQYLGEYRIEAQHIDEAWEATYWEICPYELQGCTSEVDARNRLLDMRAEAEVRYQKAVECASWEVVDE